MSHRETAPEVEPARAPSFEQALKRLEAIVARLESGELSLEEALQLFEEGVRMARHCSARLEEAEGRLEALLRDEASGALMVRTFEPEGRGSLPEAAEGMERGAASG